MFHHPCPAPPSLSPPLKVLTAGSTSGSPGDGAWLWAGTGAKPLPPVELPYGAFATPPLVVRAYHNKGTDSEGTGLHRIGPSV